MKPNQKAEIVGKKPAWVLLAEVAGTASRRCVELREMGAFTAREFGEKAGWSRSKAKHFLENRPKTYRTEVAPDERAWKNAPTRFYFPPHEKH